MSITSSVNKLNVSEQTKEILKKTYDVNINRDYPSVNTNPDIFLNIFNDTKNILKEFGYDGSDEELAKKFFEIHSTELRKKCLVLESIRCFDAIEQLKINIFHFSAQNIYARAKLYNELKEQNDSKLDKITLSGFIQDSIVRIENEFGISSEELRKKYPLTKQKLQLMERIHNAKKNAQSKSGGVSL